MTSISATCCKRKKGKLSAGTIPSPPQVTVVYGIVNEVFSDQEKLLIRLGAHNHSFAQHFLDVEKK